MTARPTRTQQLIACGLIIIAVSLIVWGLIAYPGTMNGAHIVGLFLIGLAAGVIS